MQKLKLNFLFLAAALFLFGASHASFAQQKTISPEKQALIREYLEVLGGRESINEMLDVMLSIQEKEPQKILASMIEEDKTLSPAQKHELQQQMAGSRERITKRARDFFTKRVNLAQILEEVSSPIYDKHFSEADLRELIAFYRKPVGQKMISLMPAMTLEMMTAFSDKLTPKLQEFIKETTEAELAEMKKKLPAPGAH